MSALIKRTAALALLAGACCTVFAAEDLPVVNPSFENEQAEAGGPLGAGWQRGAGPPGWHYWIGAIARKGNPLLHYDRTAGRTGTHSVALQACKGTVCVIQSVPVKPKETYLCTVWAKTTNPKSGCKLLVRWQDAEGKWANNDSVADDLRAGPGSETWTELAVPFQAPDNAGFAVILLSAADQGDEDKCWFDDVRLQHIGAEDVLVAPCGWLHPNCAPAGAPAETAHVDWAQPYAGRRLKTLFILGSDHNLREHIEVAQRLDLDCDWAFTHAFGTALYALENKKIMSRLDQGWYDVAIVSVKAPQPMVRGLLKRCGGVVLVGFRQPREREKPDGTATVSWSSMLPAIPEGLEAAPAGPDHFVAEPLDALPRIPLTGDPSVDRIEVVDGDKRLVRVVFNTRFLCLTPIFDFDDHLRMPPGYWEAQLQVLLRAILWAGRNATPAHVACTADADSATVTVSSPTAGDFTLQKWVCCGPDAGTMDSESVTLAAGQTRTFELGIPATAPSGPVTVGAVLRTADGRSAGFGAARVEVSRSPRIVEAAPTQPYFVDTDEAVVRVKIEGPADGLPLAVSLVDTDGREHAVTELGARTGENLVRLPLARRLSNFNWIHVRLGAETQPADTARWYLLAPMPRQPWLDAFQIGTWAASAYMPAYLQPALHRLMKEAGLTEGLQGRAGYLSMLAAGLRPISFSARVPGFRRWDQDETVREPCLSNPETRQRMADAARSAAELDRGVSPLFIYLQDETSLVKDHRDLDVCSCEHCQQRYRAWLQQRYADLEDLNREWRTSYASWSEVGFTTYKEVRGTATYAPWLMYRRFMDWTWAEGVAWSAENAKLGDPDVLVSMPNTFGLNPFAGRDYYRLSKVNDYRMEYARETRSKAGGFFDALRSFAPRVRDHPWVGYKFDDETILYAPWWTAFHGATGFSVYGTLSFFAGKNSWAQIFPTLQHTRRGLLYAEQARELCGGIGKILIEARRVQAPIAVLWSQPSLCVAWVASEQTGHPMNKSLDNRYGHYFGNRETFRLAIAGSGRQFDYVTEEQIATGVLDPYQCLVLPAAYALGEGSLARLRTFLEAGGTVVATPGVGLTNEAGAVLEAGAPQTRLFGFTRTAPEVSCKERELRLTLAPDADPATFTSLARDQVEAVDAVDCQKYDDGALALIRTRHGKGQAIFLNFVSRDATALRAVFAGLPRTADVTSLDGAERPADYECVQFDMGGNRYLGVTHGHLNDDPNHDAVQLRLPAAAQVYDVRARRALGRTDRIEAQLPPGHAAFYALLNYEVTRVKVACRRTRRGQDGRVSCGIRAKGARAGDHVVRVTVATPDGAEAPAYCRNVVARGGKAAFSIPFALSDPPGKWTVTCRDVASGVEGEDVLTVK